MDRLERALWERVRVAANGRHEVRCLTCRNWFWLTQHELDNWSVCLHCVGWSTFTGATMPSRKLEHFHLVRAGFWVLLAPLILLTSLKDAVWVVILLSLYANLAGDVSAWQAAKADRHAKS